MNLLERAGELIQVTANIVAFTGAGASTESNIPDFRSSQGLYNTKSKYEYPPEVMLSHTFFEEHTDLFYEYYKNNLIYREAKPNHCHLALAELERQGKLKAVVTQNVDGLHQAAGSGNVLDKMILINKSATPYDNKAQVVINHSAGETMSRLVGGESQAFK